MEILKFELDHQESISDLSTIIFDYTANTSQCALTFLPLTPYNLLQYNPSRRLSSSNNK